MTSSLFSQFEFDHIGIAVHSLAEGRVFYENLGFHAMAEERVETEKVVVGMFQLNNQCKIELLEPTAADSPIAKFLAQRGPGVHHFCLRVKDIASAVVQLKSKGVRLINEEPRAGAHGCKVVFVHPRSAGGVLVELSQPPGVDQ